MLLLLLKATHGLADDIAPPPRNDELDADDDPVVGNNPGNGQLQFFEQQQMAQQYKMPSHGFALYMQQQNA
jgi:hypothetical protein